MAWSFGRAVITVVMALPVTGIRATQAQEFKGPIWGSGGGTTSYDLDCGSTGVLVGVYGKKGQWIDQIGLICQRLNADGSLGSSYTRGPVGGSGGDGGQGRCEQGKAVGGMFAWSGNYINIVLVDCYPWSASSHRPNYGGAKTVGYFGATVATPSQNTTVTCPTEKVGKAIRGKYGWYIDSLQFVCDDYNK